MPSPARRIVLVGAGHAHLYALRRAADFARRNFELVVIAPEDFWYSGLATGVLGGIYPASLDRIDVARLLAGSGARLIRQAMSGFDLAERHVVLDDGASIGFDALSLNLGSVVPTIPGSTERAFTAKPVTRLIELRSVIEAEFRREPRPRPAVAIVGGGVTGFEIAASVSDLTHRHAASANIVVYSGDRPLPNLPRAAADSLVAFLRQRGVDVRIGARVERIDGQQLTLDDGTSEAFDYLVNATGLAPSPLLRATGLPTTDDGALIVDDRLMASGGDGVFAAGDCIALNGQSLPRVGVYAIRQAPILFHNLMAHIEGNELKRFVPQQRYLSIMTLGSGSGLAYRAGLWWRGRAAFAVKDWIDRRFLRNHQPSTKQDAYVSPADDGKNPDRRDRSASVKL